MIEVDGEKKKKGSQLEKETVAQNKVENESIEFKGQPEEPSISRK